MNSSSVIFVCFCTSEVQWNVESNRICLIVSQPWQVSSSRPCEEDSQPDTVRPPRPPSPDGPAHLKSHNNSSEKSFPSSPRPSDSDWPRIHHCSRRTSLTLYRLIYRRRLRVRCGTESRRRLKPPQTLTSDRNRKCLLRRLQWLHVRAALPQRRSKVSDVNCGWEGRGLQYYMLCCAELLKQVSLTSEVCGDWTGLRSVWTTVRQEGGVSTGASIHRNDIIKKGLDLIG